MMIMIIDLHLLGFFFFNLDVAWCVELCFDNRKVIYSWPTRIFNYTTLTLLRSSFVCCDHRTSASTDIEEIIMKRKPTMIVKTATSII